MPLHRFDAGADSYTLHDKYLQAYRDNFADVVARTTRMPGVSGGFDEFGFEVAPREIGNVSQTFFLVAETRSAMADLREAVRETVEWGKGQLFMRPTDYVPGGFPLAPERFCWARVNNINMPKSEHLHTDLWQPVTINWQVSDPRWLYNSTETDFIDLTSTSGNDTFNVSIGNMAVRPVIVVNAGDVGDSITDITIQRSVGMTVVDELFYEGTISEAGTPYLQIDCEAWSVIKSTSSTFATGNTDAFDSTFTFEHPDWMRLQPGNNSISVSADSLTGTVRVAFTWQPAFV